MLIRIALGQFNPLVGDVPGNVQRLRQLVRDAKTKGANAVVFPELAICGYPPEDLVLRRDFLSRCEAGVAELAEECPDLTVIVGVPLADRGQLFNCAALLRGGKVEAVYRKQALPNYGVFDEKRYFAAGSDACVIALCGAPVGITICEDVWVPGPVEVAVASGARLILNLNASPFHVGKAEERLEVARTRVAATGVPLLYVNQIGGQDELIFDGGSFAMDEGGAVFAQAAVFEEQLLMLDLTWDGEHFCPVGRSAIEPEPADHWVRVYRALVLGIRDYASKNRFKGAVLGLSGGIDSALTLVLAVDALGPEHVEAVLMPSVYTSEMSIADALEEVQLLGCTHHVVSIEPAVASFAAMLAPLFAGLPADATEENVQARCRGIVLMALSNKTGKILLTTGNKSEMSVGYATLYGDMAGGFAPLKDVFKMGVYALARCRNRMSPVIPERVLTRRPTAELRPDQFDEDSLLPYPQLDDILHRYIELDQSFDEIVAAGHQRDAVARIVRLVDLNEYKRRQSPPGVRITRKAFGRERRFPITSGFRHDSESER